MLQFKTEFERFETRYYQTKDLF